MFCNKNEFNQQFAHFVNINSNAEKSIHEWCICDTQICMCSNYMQKIASINSDSNKFMSAGQEVCSCEYVGDFINPTSNLLSSYLPIQSINPSLSDCKQGVHSDIMNVRKRSIGLPDIDENLLKILSLAYQNVSFSFKHCEKSARGLHNGVSHRRSIFVGVLRNRERWQVLINEGKKKRYIGTYSTEIEAAIVNDFYSIGINFLKAKTNFHYSQELIISMIESYFSQGKVFDPSLFASQVVRNMM